MKSHSQKYLKNRGPEIDELNGRNLSDQAAALYGYFRKLPDGYAKMLTFLPHRKFFMSRALRNIAIIAHVD
ncbi:MAG: hypothetical protein Q8K43_01610, partial [Sulfurimicrobium sp.]|nr:hypothetical protein [Sulfurimicrobium sp.]